jgi:hypothetical protein
MYLHRVTYAAAAGFVTGYDFALDGAVLEGFREWLIPRVGGCDNLTSTELVLCLAFPDSADPNALIASDVASERRAIDMLFVLIAEFDAFRDAPEGLENVYAEYERWLSTQAWYTSRSSGPK